MRGLLVFFVVFSFHNMLDIIREPAFYWVFYFPNLSVFVSSYIKMMTNLVIVLPGVGGLYWNCHVHLSVCDSVHVSSFVQRISTELL